MYRIDITSPLTEAQRRALAAWLRAEPGPDELDIGLIPGTRTAFRTTADPHQAARRVMVAIGRTFEYTVTCEPGA